MKKWKTLSSKKIFIHPRLTLLEDEILLPNGAKTTYLKYDNISDSVSIICRREDGKILLTTEYSYPPQEIIYQFPGGFTKNEENLTDGAQRELMEETNLKAGKLELLGSYLWDNRRTDSKVHVYLATILKEEKTDGDTEEEIESFWFSENEIDQMIKEGKIVNSHTLASWSLHEAI